MAKKPTKLDEVGKKFGATSEKALNDALKLIEKRLLLGVQSCANS